MGCFIDVSNRNTTQSETTLAEKQVEYDQRFAQLKVDGREFASDKDTKLLPSLTTVHSGGDDRPPPAPLIHEGG